MQAVRRVLIIALIAVTTASAQQRCEDITKLDVRNQTIRTAQRTFVFHEGIALNQDGPLELWKAAIEKDIVVEPAPNVVVRFFVIHDSHETGSGWRYYATGFRCSGGEMHEVFHRDGLSLTVDRIDSTVINVSSMVTPGAASRKHWSYTWDRSASIYALSSK
jgi:hypothetical protein